MTERELWDYIEEMGEKGSVYGLDNMHRLLDKEGHPEKKLHIIHIAGTNGKGSTAVYIASILKGAGYRTGVYSSPAVFDYREKISVNGKNISVKSLCEYVEYIKGICEEIVSDGFSSPTLFEIETAIAYKYFADKECDFAVIECGCGGRDDATNAIDEKELAVFAKISMDHMKLLGDTIEKIADAKSGIIKKGCSVITIPQDEKAYNQLKKTADENGCEIYTADEPEKIRTAFTKTVFNLPGFDKLETNMLGTYQPLNSSVAVKAALILRERGFKIGDSAVRKGIANAINPGRFEVIGKSPLFIIDGAHNEDAARALAESMDKYLSDKPLIFICGVLADKAYDRVMELTTKRASFIITVTPPENKRALDKQVLADTILKYNKNVTTADSVEEAAEMALLLAGQKQNKCAIVAYGSLSYLGRLKRYVTGGVCVRV